MKGGLRASRCDPLPPSATRFQRPRGDLMCFLYDLISRRIRSGRGNNAFFFSFLISSPPPCLCFLSNASSLTSPPLTLSHPSHPSATFTAGGRKRLSVCFSSAVKIRLGRLHRWKRGRERKGGKKTGRFGVFCPTSKRRLDLTGRPNKAPGPSAANGTVRKAQGARD